MNNETFELAPLKEEGKYYSFDKSSNEKTYLSSSLADDKYKEIKEESKKAYEGLDPITTIPTPQEFADKILRILTYLESDYSQSHQAADNLSESLLIALGYGEAIKISRSFGRYYS